MTKNSDTRKLIVVIQVVLWVFVIGNTTYHWGKVDGLSQALDIMLAAERSSTYAAPPVIEPPLPYPYDPPPIPDLPPIPPNDLDALENTEGSSSDDCYFKIGGEYRCKESEDEEKTPGQEWWEYETKEGEQKV